LSTAAIEIRNAIRDRLIRLKRYKKVRTQPTPKYQEADLPCATAFILNEVKEADGDDNAGPPHYEVTLTIGVSVVMGGGKVEAIDADIDADLALIEDALLTDPAFVRIGMADADFEGIPQITTRRLFPEDGSLYLAEARMEIVFKYRLDYPPKTEIDPDTPDMELAFKPAFLIHGEINGNHSRETRASRHGLGPSGRRPAARQRRFVAERSVHCPPPARQGYRGAEGRNRLPEC